MRQYQPEFPGKGVGDKTQENQTYCGITGRICQGRRCKGGESEREMIIGDPDWTDNGVRESQYGSVKKRARNLEERIQKHRDANPPDDRCSYLDVD